MTPKTLYVSDLDGTLLSTDSRISARSAETISRLTSDDAEDALDPADGRAAVITGARLLEAVFAQHHVRVDR